MKFVIIVGPQAVGKMTVGQELEKVTGLQLFHNHLTIELVLPYFDYATKAGQRLVHLFREEIFREYAKSDKYGMIFTYVWAFNSEKDHAYVQDITKIFEEAGGEVFVVELEAELDARLERNRHEHRLAHKPSKRNIAWSENHLLESMEFMRLNSFVNEVPHKNYVRINNTNLSPEETAQKIKAAFNL
ncbi:AAA family ATPase [Paenisporosarcina cavernae]|uniref:Shikimate kinase n=1 Tax=Paenisporosarcina cavernae TaxID=2320858 RepID=A0A385YPB7_9BACL|nr:AAA family ATPase [Paenisporosarcina cavernae]AYC28539.1 shikimate kinase [Paenisporosarcina cavernae]